MRHVLACLGLLGCLWTSGQVLAEDEGAYDRARQAVREASADDENGRHELATRKFEKALALRPNHPGLIYALAQTTAASGNTDAALGWLDLLADLGITTDLGRAEALAPLRKDPRYEAIAKRIAANGNSRGAPAKTFTASETLLLVEGVAFDPVRDRFFLSSIYERKIVSTARDGTIAPFAGRAAGLWSPTGMTVDGARGLLVVASAATPQTPGISAEDRGKSAVHLFDLETGTMEKSWHSGDGKHWFGDVALGEDGTIYVSDSLQRQLYYIPGGTGDLEVLVAHPDFPSPQGIALSDDGAFLYLADYAMGLFRIDLGTKAVTRLAPSRDLAPYGIDGLYYWQGDLIAIQNGTSPQRIIRIELNEAGDQILGAHVLAANHPDFLEPTLGVIIGDTFHFVANSGWPRFGKLPEDPAALRKELPATIVLEIDLSK